MRGLTVGLDRYDWNVGTAWSKRPPIPMPYLIGVPKQGDDANLQPADTKSKIS